jgi:hypothetical protein
MDRYFDFVCISLNKSRDRRKSSHDLFKKLNIKVNWWIVDKHPSGGTYGCFESHVSVWNCTEFTKEFLCVFEDDLEFSIHDTISFKQALQFAYQNMPQNFDVLNLEPRCGFVEQKLTPFAYSGAFINGSSYIIHRSFLPTLTSRVLPWYGMNLDVALYKNARQVGIFPPIFKQIGYDSDISPNNLIPNNVKESCRKLMASSSLLGWIVLELAQLKDIYYIYNTACPELKDRRTKI